MVTYGGYGAGSGAFGLAGPGKGAAWGRLGHLAARLVIVRSGHLSISLNKLLFYN